MEITNSLGTVVWTEGKETVAGNYATGSQKTTFALDGISSGSYIVKVSSETGVFTSNVVIK